MSLESDINAVYNRIFAELNSNPIQQMNAIAGDEAFNINIANAHNRAIRESLTLLARKVDELEGRVS